MSDCDNKGVAYMSFLVFRGEQGFKAVGCQSTIAMHSWYTRRPGNKFDLASVVKEPVRQTNKFYQIANINAVFGQMSCMYGLLGCTVSGIFRLCILDRIISSEG